MTAIYPYLTFENAKEAMAYYEQDFGAQITYHEALTKEQAESLGLPVDQLDQTTMRGEFMIAGQKIICADATMGNPQTSTLISILLDCRLGFTDYNCIRSSKYYYGCIYRLQLSNND